VVETSGLALPEPLLAAFRWPEIRTRTRVNGVVAVVDGEALAGGSVVADPAALEAQRLADPSLDHATAIDELFEEQLEVADLVLVSRADRVEAATLAEVSERLAPRLRPGTTVLPMRRGEVDPDLVLGLENGSQAQPSAPEPVHGDDDHPVHDHSHVEMMSHAVQLSGRFDRQALEAALADLIRRQGLMRLKGRVRLEGKVRPLQISAVGPRLECWFEDGGANDGDTGPGLDLVALGLRIDPDDLRAGLETARL
jgi:cobalamin biosynthesis protein CobW